MALFTAIVLTAPVALYAQNGDQGSTYAKATFAGGCFWCMEPPYDELEGVISTISGYSGGNVPNPSYEQVSSGRTGHTEVVQIEYDPSKISYQELLEVFWRNVDPVDAGGQFCDRAINTEQRSSTMMSSSADWRSRAKKPWTARESSQGESSPKLCR